MGKSKSRRGENAVAFTISYKGKEPTTVQQVVNKISYMFLDENIKAREKQATDSDELGRSVRETSMKNWLNLKENISMNSRANFKLIYEISIKLKAILNG